jgi:hypothetical protein
VCEECGERTVLGEPLSVWCSQSTHFGCECGRELTTLADRLDRKRVGGVGDTTSARGGDLAVPPSPL